MTFLDAILATLSGLWGFASAPILVFLYGFAIICAGFVIFATGFVGDRLEYPFWTRIPYWLIGLAILLLGVAVLVFVASNAPTPFTWGAA